MSDGNGHGIGHIGHQGAFAVTLMGIVIPWMDASIGHGIGHIGQAGEQEKRSGNDCTLTQMGTEGTLMEHCGGSAELRGQG